MIIPMLLLEKFGVGAKARGGSGAAVSGDVVGQLHSYCLQFPQYWNDAKGCGDVDVDGGSCGVADVAGGSCGVADVAGGSCGVADVVADVVASFCYFNL